MTPIKLTVVVIAVMTIAYVSFTIGQDNPLPKPLSSTATISCPFGSNYSIARGSDATVTVKCVTE